MSKKERKLITTEQAIKRPGAGFAKHPENINREGKGGFQEHPENINCGGRPKNQESFVYWMNYFKNMSLEEFKTYKTQHPDMSMAALAAFARVEKAIEKLEEFREVANRTEGMPTQRTEITGKEGEPFVFDVKLRHINDNSDKDKSTD